MGLFLESTLRLDSQLGSHLVLIVVEMVIIAPGNVLLFELSLLICGSQVVALGLVYFDRACPEWLRRLSFAKPCGSKPVASSSKHLVIYAPKTTTPDTSLVRDVCAFRLNCQVLLL